MDSSNKALEVRGFPYVSRLPVVGPLLSYTQDSEVRTELLIILTPTVIHNNDEDQNAMIRYAESERMSWCLADVVDIYGDVGLSARPGWWCDGEWQCRHRAAPVIFPHVDPAGANVEPVPQPIEADELDPALPVLPSSRRTHQGDNDTTNNQATMGAAPIPSVAPSYHHPSNPRAPVYRDVPAAYERRSDAAMGQARFPESREMPGRPYAVSGGRTHYQGNPEPYPSPNTMPMAR